MTNDPSTVLFCYDGSEQAQHALSVTAKLFPGAHAHVLHVWEPIERIVARYAVLAPYMGEEVGEADVDAQSASAKLAADGAGVLSAAGLQASSHTSPLRSTVWEAVLESADALDADVIVTGTRSLHGLREMISNTLSHALIQHSARPVLAIPTPVAEARD